MGIFQAYRPASSSVPPKKLALTSTSSVFGHGVGGGSGLGRVCVYKGRRRKKLHRRQLLLGLILFPVHRENGDLRHERENRALLGLVLGIRRPSDILAQRCHQHEDGYTLREKGPLPSSSSFLSPARRCAKVIKSARPPPSILC